MLACLLHFTQSTTSTQISHQAHPCSAFQPRAISLSISGDIRIQSLLHQPAGAYPRRPPSRLVAAYPHRLPSLPQLTLASIIRATADKPEAPLTSKTTKTGTFIANGARRTNSMRYVTKAAARTADNLSPTRREDKARNDWTECERPSVKTSLPYKIHQVLRPHKRLSHLSR